MKQKVVQILVASMLCVVLFTVSLPGVQGAKMIRYMEERKNGGTAFLWSMVLPGAGHWYCDEWGKGFLFLTLELGAMVAALTVGVEASHTDYAGNLIIDEVNGIFWAGLGVLLAARIWEWVDMFAAVKRFNRRLQIKMGITPNDKLSLDLQPRMLTGFGTSPDQTVLDGRLGLKWSLRF